MNIFSHKVQHLLLRPYGEHQKKSKEPVLGMLDLYRNPSTFLTKIQLFFYIKFSFWKKIYHLENRF